MHNPSSNFLLPVAYAALFSFLDQPLFLTHLCKLLFLSKSHKYQCTSNFILLSLISLCFYRVVSAISKTSLISYINDSHIYVHGLFNHLLFISSCRTRSLRYQKLSSSLPILSHLFSVSVSRVKHPDT